MLVKDVLLRDPATHPLANNGQARIVTEAGDEKAGQELRAELATFVCEGQYADGIQRILSTFLADQNKTSQRAAWVSGFFGSGKSHLLKMLCHLWQNTPFSDGSTARSLVPSLPEEIRSLLRELDTAGKRSGGLFAAAGTMPAGTTDNVRLSVLSILLRAAGLPEQFQLAQFYLWLEENGHLESVRARVAAAGKAWERELNNLYVSPWIAKALLECDHNFATSEAEARKSLREQFPHRSQDLSTPEFVDAIRRILRRAGQDGRQPCTVLILDEVQQFIGDSETRSVLITEIAEAIAKELNGQVMLVCAGQSALAGMSLLQKLLDRFTIRVQLSDTDVEAVTRSVLLQKRPSARPAVDALLNANAGEISRQLQGTKIAERIEDARIKVEDYPLLPVRRRFWEQCFRQIDVAGTQSQLRSQLRILHDSLARQADKPLGTLIPGDDLYDALAAEMVSTGALPGEIRDRILALGQDGEPGSRLAQRICGLVFLIGQLKPGTHANIGVRAIKEHIADLLVDSLTAENGALRHRVGQLLDELADRGVLMKVGEEYRIQTEEGRSWDQEFRNREVKLRNDLARFDEQREALFSGEIDDLLKEINRKLVQGEAKVPRRLAAFRSSDPPQGDGQNIPVWIRDQFSGTEKEVVAAARAAGTASPTLFVLIPKKLREELAGAIAAAEAAEQMLAARGVPGTEEGKLARQSMESRLRLAKEQRSALVHEIVGDARVLQGGGSESLALTLDAKLREAAEASLARMFPQFKEADAGAGAWAAVLKRARDGAENPFAPVKYEGPLNQHPVCQEIRLTIGSGAPGTKIRQTLESSPFGWPRDAVDAALIAMHRGQLLAVTSNGAPVQPGQLDQAKIPRAEFRVENAPLGVEERLKLRGLFQHLGISCKSGEELAKAPLFLQALLTLSREAGGAPPLPAPPAAAAIEDMQKLVGNEQLATICGAAESLRRSITERRNARQLGADRLPQWSIVESLARHANGLAGSEPVLKEVAAIRSERLLLEPSNPATPVKAQLAGLLRDAVRVEHARHAGIYAEALKTLESAEDWSKLSADQQAAVLGQAGLHSPQKPALTTDEELVSALERQSLAARRDEADAIPARVTAAMKAAAQLVEPKTQFVAVEKTTLKSEEDVRRWADRQVERMISALVNGPVQIE